MTDTAIPLPEGGERALAEQAEPLRCLLREAVAPALQALHDAAEAGMAAMQRAVHQAAQRQRVHAAMPRLTMRAVMVHGLVPYRTEPTHDHVKEI